MVQQVFYETGTSQCTRQRQMSFRRLLDVVNEFGGAEPSLFSLRLSILCGPANLSAKNLKVSLALPPSLLLYTVSELTTRELVPQTFHGGEIRAGNVLDVGKVYKIPTLLLSSRKLD